MTERRHQEAIALWLDSIGVLWMHTPNEGKRTGWQGFKLKRQGLKSGVPDVLVFTPVAGHRGAAVELKVKGGRVTQAQQRWLDSLHECGWAVRVCYGANEAIDWLKGLGYGRR